MESLNLVRNVTQVQVLTPGVVMPPLALSRLALFAIPPADTLAVQISVALHPRELCVVLAVTRRATSLRLALATTALALKIASPRTVKAAVMVTSDAPVVLAHRSQNNVVTWVAPWVSVKFAPAAQITAVVFHVKIPATLGPV